MGATALNVGSKVDSITISWVPSQDLETIQMSEEKETIHWEWGPGVSLGDSQDGATIEKAHTQEKI